MGLKPIQADQYRQKEFVPSVLKETDGIFLGCYPNKPLVMPGETDDLRQNKR